MLKYKVRIPTQSGVTATTINVPLSMDNQMIDQSEIIERKFVDVEVEKAINPIVDYEKSKFYPKFTSGFIERMIYEVSILDSGSYMIPTRYNDIGFADADLNSRTNSFTNTFLRLSFYDTDNTLTQNLISYITLFPQIEEADFNIGANKNLCFKIGNPKLKDGLLSTYEGFYLYHFSDEVTTTEPKELFMRADFNNAKDGKTVNLMTVDTPTGIENLINQLHTKYILNKDINGYYYEVDETYSTNVSGTFTRTIKLWELDSL